MSDPASVTIDLLCPDWRDDPESLRRVVGQGVGTKIRIDADVARPVDTLTVQVLLAARRACLSSGGVFELHNASQPFIDGLKQLGLHSEFCGQGGAV